MLDSHPLSRADWLTATKFKPPPQRSEVVIRRPLLESLRQALLSHRLTLVSAPAGYGKSTLLASLPRELPDLPFCWLSLDEEDADPARFLRALVGALQRLDPACGATARALLATTPDPGREARRIMGVLINDMLETYSEPFVLVLDDLHLVTEPAIHAALDYLIERMPTHMRVAVASRHDPPLSLARLRARGQLAEIRLRDLRLTPEESEALLNHRLGLGLTPDDLRALDARAEGWPAGLCLLAGSLQQLPEHADRAALIHHLAHTDRYVFDFLAEEVLEQQTPVTRAFLLETSILDELAPDMCQAVTGLQDARARLEDLYRRNLFLIAVENPHGAGTDSVFRYHALFGAFLRAQLEQERARDERAELHRRAAEAEALPARKVRHYLAGQLWEQAADLLEREGQSLLGQGMLGSLRGWIESLPEPVREQRPQLALFLGLCELHRRNLQQAALHLDRAVQGLEARGEAALQGQALAYLAQVAFYQTEFQRGLDVTARALSCPIPPRTRVQLLMERARARVVRADYGPALVDLEAALEVAQETPGPETLFPVLANYIHAFAALPGGLDHLERLCQQAGAVLGEASGPLHAVLDCQWTLVHLYRGRFREAQRAAESALALGERFGGLPMWLYWTTAASLLGVQTARGERPLLKPYVERLAGQTDFPPAGLPGMLYVFGHLSWLQGLHDDARQLWERLRTVEARPEGMVWVWKATLEGLLAASAGEQASALRLLREAADVEARLPHFNTAGSARVLLAWLYLEMHRADAALREAEAVLAEGQRRGAPGIILAEGRAAVPVLRLAVARGRQRAYAARLLDRLDYREQAPAAAQAVLVPETGETLTPRETEVLRLIAGGASNRDLAEQLVITERTAKAHVTNILAKLQVSSRTQAAARARELRLA